MATLLVIGGSGFFGKSILDMFQRGELSQWQIDKVIAMSRNAERLRSEVPELVKDNVDLLSLDITTADYLPAADYVIHAAASTDARNYINAGEKERKNIQAGVINYSRLAKKYHKNSKIVYVSSGAVYGTQPDNISHISEDFRIENPDDIPEVKRDYAIAKRDAEKLIIELGRSRLSVSIARCFAFTGKYLPRDQHFAIGNFIADGLAGRPIIVKADHVVYRSYMYADDLVRWMMTILTNSNFECPVFNVGSEHAVTMAGLATKIGDYFGVEVKASKLSSDKVDRYVPSTKKAFNELELKCNFSLAEAIQHTVGPIESRS